MKVPFKVIPQGRKANKAVEHNTLRKMGLIEDTSLTVGPSRARKTTARTSLMTLLHTLVRKVSKVLNNYKTLASNQKQLAACYNVDHLKHPIHLGSVSGLDSKPEIEAGFEVQSPQL